LKYVIKQKDVKVWTGLSIIFRWGGEVLMDLVMNFRVPYTVRKFFTGCATISSSRKAEACVV
jgi:ABC-type molybdate transport system permease subunit